MRRIVMTIAIITFAIFGLMFYQYHIQKQEVEQFDLYQSVLNQKTSELYEQAKDWSNPIQIETQDSRLSPDFQVMADFMLNIMVKNAELRNSYLRRLKEAQWDKFLDVQRLEKDKKNDYVETQQMLTQVDEMIQAYQQNLDEHQHEIQKEIKALPIKARFRRYLTEALVKNAEQDGEQKLFNLEKQSYAKAQQAFTILKSQKWEVKNNTFLFENQKVVNEFNQLFQDMLALDKQMKQISQSTKKELDKAL